MASIFKEASDEARLLRHGSIGPEDFLLAILKQPSIASEAAGDVGLTYERLFSDMRSHRFDPPVAPADPDASISPNPIAYRLMGWADGYATHQGHEPTAVDWLLAYVYVQSWRSGYLEAMGTSAGAVVDALARRGVVVPTMGPPRFRPWRGHQRIDVSEGELESVLKVLNERYPPGSDFQWGFNWTTGEPRHPYIVAEEGLDLEAILDEARRSSS